MFLITLFIGLVMLVGGAELLVRGGGQLALALRVPALIVGLTVVAFGTSMPELVVSVTAALGASTDMALANVTGSNIANIALVLGLAAMVSPMVVDRSLMRRDVPSCFGMQVLVPVLAWDGVIGRGDGAILFGGGLLYNAWLLVEALRGRAVPLDDDLNTDDAAHPFKHLASLVIGVAILVAGAQLFVGGAVGVAEAVGLSDRFIGLTVIAIGTSAPELATAVASARRGETDLAVGNSLGSNILNIAMVLGITAMIAPIFITDPASMMDLGVALGVTLLMVPFVLKGRIGRVEGGVMVAAYAAYLGVPLAM